MPLEEYPAPVAQWVLICAILGAAGEPLTLSRVQQAIGERTRGRTGHHAHVVKHALLTLESDDLVVVGTVASKGRDLTTYALTPAGVEALEAARARVRLAIDL